MIKKIKGCDSMKRVLIAGLFWSGLLVAGGDIAPIGENMDMIDVGYSETSQTTYSKNLIYIQRKEKLMWQDEKYMDDEEGAYQNHRSLGKAGNWNHAEMYCRSLDYAGYIDWRLPTVDELMNLHQYKTQLQHSQAVDFWTSTPDKGINYWSVYTADGSAYSHKKNDFLYLRCVRDYEGKRKRSSRSGRL